MTWIIAATLLSSVLKAALCFNIEPVAWKTLSNSAAGFGYQVVQRQTNLLISAPLAQYSANGKGEIYSCTISNANCQKIQPLTVPDFAVNMSLGLTMAYDPTYKNTLACGPTIPKDCKSITMYNGMCFQIDNSNRFGSPIPPSLEECRVQADIAFLLDGSGSVNRADFQRMKTFVKDLIKSFLAGDTQFSVSQFSDRRTVHYYFNDFFRSPSWESNIDNIAQLSGGTYTAMAIKYVVNNVFVQWRGSRPNVKKVLIVITDGESHDRFDLWDAARFAEQQKIVRFAIGVGRAFNVADAKQELHTIASNPSDKHVFQVSNFAALDEIKTNLQDRIFSIEGSQSSGESLKMEMSQQGFSAAFVPGGYQLGIVGANGWRGGYRRYGSDPPTYAPEYMEPDSYLGYSMAVARSRQGSTVIVGAPRYQHRGAVRVIFKENTQTIDPNQLQSQFPTGAYFGAVVCAMHLDYDIYTDLILISAPMYKEPDREGRVYVCTLNNVNVECHLDSNPLVLRGQASENGRFGSSLAVLPDLNADGFSDLAVGAPLENDGQGSIYIFQGEGGIRISPTFSQRIAASEVQPGLKFFGTSISQSTFDLSGDQLPDLAVGSKGKVVLLRSRPIVMVEALVSYSPKQIPTQISDCSKTLEHTAEICITMTPHTAIYRATANIHFNLTLDSNRKVPNNRAYFSEKQKRDITKTVIIDLNTRQCSTVKFFIEACQEDALNPLSNELRFTFDSRPLETNLKPSLAQQAQTTTTYPLGFEINCGTDNKCVDNLNLDFNFTGSSEVKVGIDELLDVTVFVENAGENSYNSHVILTYPAGLSYRKVTSKGRIVCSSLDSEDGSTRGKTECTVDRPIFKGNTKALFIVSYGIDINTQLANRIVVTANATSGNQDHLPSSRLYKQMGIDVKYSIFVTTESSLSYNNFTFGKNNLKKPFQQSIKVTNDIRALSLTVVIKIPVKLGGKDIWADGDSFQIQDCIKGQVEAPAITDFVSQIQKNKSVDCSVATCGVFRCTRFMARLESKTYVISANLSSGWIEQIGLQSAKFLLTSTVSLEYDRSKYIFFSTGSNNNPPVRKVEAEVEVYPEPDFTKEIVGGSLGGLAFLALLTAGLYKAGFFKSKYQEMINESAEGEGAGPEVNTDTPLGE
ncbi:integrin alpha-M-like [Parambassis ranga]|uniref:Integrin alpha-M-like n=1 Tax=Parambassis ranga TaxID=210632 RepID=A0A6P7KDE5_9TELE|nr:integrin alpha-M-like [Parambassis ranga]